MFEIVSMTLENCAVATLLISFDRRRQIAVLPVGRSRKDLEVAPNLYREGVRSNRTPTPANATPPSRAAFACPARAIRFGSWYGVQYRPCLSVKFGIRRTTQETNGVRSENDIAVVSAPPQCY
jgi:hypothetical protein